LRWPSSTLKVPGSIPRGSEFMGWGKKNPLACHHTKAQV
jgi:hypothetical protein